MSARLFPTASLHLFLTLAALQLMIESARIEGIRTNAIAETIPNMAAMDNVTMVQVFKYLNYCQLATSSLVSKRFWNLIQTHRHSLAFLDVNRIIIDGYVTNKDPAHIGMFNKKLSPEKYNELTVRNGYSKQIPFEVPIVGKETTEICGDFYLFRAFAATYREPKYPDDVGAHVFEICVELKDDNWPLCQHFFRLLMHPFIYIRTLSVISVLDVFTLMAGAMDSNPNRLQCKQLDICYTPDSQKLIPWIKDHVRCDEFDIDVDVDSKFGFKLDNGPIYDEELLNLFLTGAPCTPAIYVRDYDLSKLIVDLVQMFMGLKTRYEFQPVERIWGKVEDFEEFKRNVAEFIAEGEQYEEAYELAHNSDEQLLHSNQSHTVFHKVVPFMILCVLLSFFPLYETTDETLMILNGPASRDHYVTEKVIDSLEAEDAASIRISQELFNKQAVAHQLAYIQCNFSILPKAITKLESQGLTLSQNLEVLAEVKTAISNAVGHIGQKIQTKLDFVMQNNPGLSKMAEIAKVQNGEEAELEVETMAPKQLTVMKYAPMVNCDVERSFSIYKNISTDNRASFSEANLEMYIIYNYETRE
ncbi:hypothetical protein DdX_13876 [Ditylenchus destructor]|uniref:F-box domain-containing protein n=1 Tax=Ditylenchus destructor TaxID=166010 RepID=A0AAD4MY60_9BILA|nr:hypothetical protein DdX_13876 [Ditylenchus destructor]